ncbi:hypothetical protein [Ligilactobacillus hohenheimensis]|uniref:hypothetical protein n=1 Tax=Ligilactobacillus hohenheimensis TaxID=2991832 RepID=UPI0024B9D3C9|nr:hypothetical protein [Ligilactobacillus hohenheimensis]
MNFVVSGLNWRRYNQASRNPKTPVRLNVNPKMDSGLRHFCVLLKYESSAATNNSSDPDVKKPQQIFSSDEKKSDLGRKKIKTVMTIEKMKIRKGYFAINRSNQSGFSFMDNLFTCVLLLCILSVPLPV